MKKILLSCFLLVSIGVHAQKKNSSSVLTARTVPFDNNWLFVRDSATNAEQPDYNDAKWKKVDLPHDWSVEDLPNPIQDSIIGPFSKGSIGGTATRFTIGGTGWYRK